MSLIVSCMWWIESRRSSIVLTTAQVSRRAAFVTFVLSETVAAHLSSPTEEMVSKKEVSMLANIR